MAERSNKGYLIRFNAEKTMFPDICPVCNEPTTTVGTIIASKSKGGEKFDREWAAPSSFGRALPSTRHTRRSGPASLRMFQIPTCEDHAYSEEETGRAKGVCVIVNGLSILGLLFVASQIGFHLIQGIPVPLWLYLLMALVIVLLIATYRGLGSSELEKAIRIVDYTEEGSTVTVRIRNEVYAEEFIRSNPHATVVRTPRNM
ncbi:MAG: hypothetical protein R6V83_14000 [Candidatus Thorarchaeota archaeon]